MGMGVDSVDWAYFRISGAFDRLLVSVGYIGWGDFTTGRSHVL